MNPIYIAIDHRCNFFYAIKWHIVPSFIDVISFMPSNGTQCHLSSTSFFMPVEISSTLSRIFGPNRKAKTGGLPNAIEKRFSPFFPFFVAGNATYKSPCRSVRPSIRPSVRTSVRPSVHRTLLFFFAFLGITAPIQGITAPAQGITAPAQPPATSVVVYTAFIFLTFVVFFYPFFFSIFCLQPITSTKKKTIISEKKMQSFMTSFPLSRSVFPPIFAYSG